MLAISNPLTRSPFQYYGGKGKMRGRLRPFLDVPSHIYCEPFAGSAICLFSREPSPVEFLNDLNGEIINFYRILQCPETFPELEHRLRYTLYSEAEFIRAIGLRDDPTTPPILRAWAWFVAQNQGMSGFIAKTRGDWGRVIYATSGGMATNTSKWKSRLELLTKFHERIQRVQIFQTDGIECTEYCDTPDTLFYVDPPYPHSTRVSGNHDKYSHELDDVYHSDLVDVLCRISGSAVISSYPNDIYLPLLDAGYRKHEIQTACHAAVKTRNSGLQGKGSALKKVPRTEVVWYRYTNPKAQRAIQEEINFEVIK